LIDYGAHIPSKAVFLVSMDGGLDALKYLIESNVDVEISNKNDLIYVGNYWAMNHLEAVLRRKF
jgi:hypothetical protein